MARPTSAKVRPPSTNPDEDRRVRNALLQGMDVSAVAERGHETDEYPHTNHAEPEPGRYPGLSARRHGARHAVFSSPERKSSDDEPESHQGHRGAHPREKSPLGRQVNPRVVDRNGLDDPALGSALWSVSPRAWVDRRSTSLSSDTQAQYGRTTARMSRSPDPCAVVWPCSGDRDWSKTLGLDGAQFVSTDYPEPDRRFSDYSVRFPGRQVAQIQPGQRRPVLDSRRPGKRQTRSGVSPEVMFALDWILP